MLPVRLSSFGLVLVVALFLGAFRIWRLGREAHFGEDKIFDAVLLVGFWGLVGARLAYVAEHWQGWLAAVAVTAYPGLAVWGGLAGGIAALWVISRKLQWDFFEAADIFMPGWLLAWSIGWLGVWLSVSRPGLITHLPLLALGLGLVVARLAGKWEKEYRTYDWYKGKRAEGRPGFVFLAGLAGMSLVQLLWDWRFAGVATAAAIAIYGRAERRLSEDLAWFTRRRPQPKRLGIKRGVDVAARK
jgi:prolipoprotein diacylglyceryltransferase